MKRFNRIIFLFITIVLPVTISGCVVTPKLSSSSRTITISTTPVGANIYIKGDYEGKSPLSITAPDNYTGTEAIKIEVKLKGYKTKVILLGGYYPSRDRFITKMGKERPLFYGDSSIARTIPAYYKFPDSIAIKLYPKND